MSYTHRISTSLFLVWGAAAAACGFDEPLPAAPMYPEQVETPPRVETPPPPPTARQRLARGLLVELDSAESAISVVAAKSGETADPQIVPAEQGEMFVKLASDALVPASLAVEMADIVIARDAFPPNGLRLTDIRASASFSSMLTIWADEGGASFSGDATVHVEWSLVTDNGVHDVRPLDLRLPIQGELEINADDRVSLAIRGSAPGLLLDVAGLAQMSDLSLELRWTERELASCTRR